MTSISVGGYTLEDAGDGQLTITEDSTGQSVKLDGDKVDIAQLVSDLDAGNQRITNVNSLTNNVSDANIQASWDGLVVPVAPGLGMEDAVDPSSTSTPVQDAVDAIDATGSGAQAGTVLLPPESVDEGAPLTNHRKKSFIGWGFASSTIRFTDLSADGLKQDTNESDDFGDSYWDGLSISGADENNRTGGSAIHFNDHTANYFNMGIVQFCNWGDPDPVIHFDGGHPFGFDWKYVISIDSNTNGVLTDDTGFTDGTIGHLKARLGDGSVALNLNGNCGLEIGYMYCEKNNGPALNESIDKKGSLQIGTLEWEGHRTLQVRRVAQLLDSLAVPRLLLAPLSQLEAPQSISMLSSHLTVRRRQLAQFGAKGQPSTTIL